MGYGNWIEERRFEFPADVVYETLLGVLTRLDLKIDTWDATLRGVVARGAPFWSLLDEAGGARVAASVTPLGDSISTATIESGPAYGAQMFGERWHRKHVDRILTAPSQALEEPKK